MKRVFLVGCPRSGTTLLQVMLGSHSSVTSFPESHFFRILLKQRPMWRRLGGFANPEIAEQIRKFTDEVKDAPPLFFQEGLPNVRRCTNTFVGMLDRITEARGKTLWIEKTPDHLLFIDEIEKLVPDSLFIHIVRDGREVVASLYEVSRKHPDVWGVPWTIDRCIDHWERAVNATFAHCRRSSRHVLVHYEDLVEVPRAQMERLASALEIQFEPEMLSRPKKRTTGFVSQGEDWKSNVYDSTIRHSRDKFYACFESGEQDYISSRVSALNTELAEHRRGMTHSHADVVS